MWFYWSNKVPPIQFVMSSEVVFGKEKLLIYDLRNKEEYQTSHLLHALNITNFEEIWSLHETKNQK